MLAFSDTHTEEVARETVNPVTVDFKKQHYRLIFYFSELL